MHLPESNSPAEAAALRLFPTNNLSFCRINDRCQTIVRIPDVPEDDYRESVRAGTLMALELVTALQAAPKGPRLRSILHDLEPHWRNGIMRNAFHQVLDDAISLSVAPAELEAASARRWAERAG